MTASAAEIQHTATDACAPLARLLAAEGLSLAVQTATGRTLRGRKRGIEDLYHLLADREAPLRGAAVADKVVGKGAAALMAAGGVQTLHAGVISCAALELLTREDIKTTYGTLVPHIIRHDGKGICPIEEACLGTDSVEGCLQAIDKFLAGRKLRN